MTRHFGLVCTFVKLGVIKSERKSSQLVGRHLFDQAGNDGGIESATEGDGGASQSRQGATAHGAAQGGGQFGGEIGGRRIKS